MNRLLDFLARALGLILGRQLWVLLGLAALVALIWLLGPLIAIDGYRPLQSDRLRLGLIAAMLTAWLMRVLYRTWRSANLNAQLLNRVREPAEGAATTADPHLEELRSRFGEAAERLKGARFAAQGGSGWGRWLERISRQYLYQLPWYLFIGAPGSGKTTALVNSGLDFPLADQFGKAAIRGVGGTRNCDWWFTNEAVLIDTAGRYTLQESHREQDQKEWLGFVELLKKYRARQPINGVMLTVSTADLLSTDEQERTQHAVRLRQRLQELRAQLGIQFPVYVLVTKIDLLSGFTEYFARFGREERSQVWGMTFPLEAVRASDFDLRRAFADEYRLLLERLYAGLPERLQGEQDPLQRELAYLLPQEFAGLQAVLERFLEQVFVESRFEANALPRGVYFTSGTQEGTVFDRVMGGIKRLLQLGGGAHLPQVGEPGRSFFLRRLMQDVIFQEAALAGRNERWQRRQAWLRRAGHALVGIGVLALGLAWFNSYRHNLRHVEEVLARVPAVAERIAGIKVDDRAPIGALMPVLDQLASLHASSRFDVDDPPLDHRFGLFQGDKLRAAADGAYARALEDVLLPHLARRLEDGLRQARPDDVEYAYGALKAYLMLYEAQHYDADYLQAWLSFDIERGPEGRLAHDQREALRRHLARLLGGRAVSSPYARDDALVAQARGRLLGHGFGERSYGSLKRALRHDERLTDFNVAEVVGPQATLVFLRVSGASLGNGGVPGLFTYRGYWEVFAPRIEDDLGARSREESWVLGLPELEHIDPQTLAKWVREVKRLYFDDYIREWEGYLADLRLRSGADLAQNIQIARALSAADSPLVRLMSAAAQETTLLREGEDERRPAAEQARGRVGAAREALESLFGRPESNADPRPSAAERPERVVDERFAALRHFTRPGEKGEPAPIQSVRDTLNELYIHLIATDTALRDGQTPPGDGVLNKVRADAGRLPLPFRNMLNELARVSDGNVSRVVHRQLGQNVAANVGDFCRQAVDGRYPLAHGSARDISPNDFAQLFAPAGLMDEFFQKNLAGLVDTSVRPWRFKGEAGGRAAYLQSFERAAVIRDVYFAGGGRTPSIRIELKPLRMDAGIAQIFFDIDGQTLRYAHGPQVPVQVQWPGPGGGNRVRLEASGPDGTSKVLLSEGPWALHRLFDGAALAPGGAPEQMIATFDIGGAKAVFQVTADGVRNPFRLAQLESFSCPRRS
jgi:type VI secretion system protein ImpL